MPGGGFAIGGVGGGRDEILIGVVAHRQALHAGLRVEDAPAEAEVADTAL
jgi:hypothetical protein